MQDSAEIDLRSDTVTKPTPEMRQAMSEAPVGDDVYGEDPTVNRLQKMAADLLGFEEGLFVPSGTMGNQTAVNVHTEPGNEVILEEKCHIFNYEMATMASFSGVMPRTITTSDGVMPLDEVKDKVQDDIYYLSRTGLICLENSHNGQGGRVYPRSEAWKVLQLATEKGIATHLDGARLFNACEAAGIEPASFAKGFDSVMFCLSKGLGAPVGSMLVGDEEFIKSARATRKRLGGGMRQVGVLAAAGIYALENNLARLKVDHRNAKKLAQGLKDLGFEIQPDPPETNILFADGKELEADFAEISDELKTAGIRVSPGQGNVTRLVTHLGISEEDVDFFLDRLKEVINLP